MDRLEVLLADLDAAVARFDATATRRVVRAEPERSPEPAPETARPRWYWHVAPPELPPSDVGAATPVTETPRPS
jgi:hypothetical protein